MNLNDFRSLEAGQVILTQKGYYAFVPAPIPPKINWTLPLVSALSEAERELSRLATLADVFPFSRLLMQAFIRREAVLSSRIEGTRATLAELYTYESAQLSFLESHDDVREVHNYVAALDYGLERLKRFPMSLRFIREIHAKLMQDVRGGNLPPGEFRRTQNWIGAAGSTLATATYVPPPVDEMNLALSELEKFIHTSTDIPTLARVAMIHYQFEAIHPFLDGNGRVGRLLMALLFAEWQILPQPLLNLSVYFERYRQEYYDHLLEVSQRGDWEAWLRFFLRGVRAQSQDSAARIERLKTIRARYQPIVDADKNSNRMGAVMDFLFGRPIFNAKQLAEGVDMPFKTARQYIEKLVQAGIVREVTGYARNQVYRADEVFTALDSNKT
ncbi:MAG TPA: Fic family protein [Anaerolineales bacterium]|nr:Fic family protein [Anaerolineales bacterium]